MIMTCITIDVDNYEFLNDPTRQRGYEGDYNALMTDYQPIDAEIIDYGISEDEPEETSKEPLLACTMPSYAAETKKLASVNVSNVTVSSKNKEMCIKVVDCEIYPWYYPKYKHQILERKYFNARKNAKKIIKCLKNGTSKPPIVIDVDGSSDTSLNVERSIKKHSSDKIASNKRKLKTSIKDKPVYSKKVYRKYWGIKRQKDISDNEMVEIQKVVMEKQTSSTMVDIRKNKGLVGMKVQRISESDKSKENCKEKSKEKNGKHKKKLSKQKYKHSSVCVKAIDKTCENLCYSNHSVFDITQIHKKSDTKRDRSKNDDETTQTQGKNELKKFVSLKCSLKINSPKILMKIKKITPSEEHESDKTKENDVAACLIANKDGENSCKNQQKPSNYNNEVRKYKPMPKSKRAALENYKNVHIEHEKPEDVENRQNKKTERLKIASTILASPDAFNKHSTNDENISATNLTQQNNETYNKSFLHTNKFTEKVLKLVEMDPKMTNKKSNTTHKKEFTKKDLETKKETFDQLKALKTVESLEPLSTKNTHNVNLENKYAVGPLSNMLSMEQELAPVTKLTVSRFQNYNSGLYSDDCDSYLINKNKNSYNLPSLLQFNENNRENNILSISSNIVNSKNNWTMSGEEVYGVDTRNSMTRSMDCTSEAILISSSSHFINQHLKEGSTIKEADKRKQSEFNLPPKNPNNNNLKANRLNQSNIYSIITSSHEPSESQEYIIPNVEQRLSNLTHGIIQNDDGDINQLKENKLSKTIALLTHSKVSVPQVISSNSQKNNGLTQKSDEYFHSDHDSRNQYTTNTVVYKSHIPLRSQISVLVPPSVISVPPDARTRPNIIRPHYEATFQRQAPPPPPPPLLPDTRYRSSSLNLPPYRQMPCSVRPQSPLKQVRQWRFNPYQQPNHAFPPGIDNINKMPRNNINQYTGINYDQNNYTQPHVCSNLSYQQMPNNAHMPPGICDVQPSNVNWSYDLFCPTIPLSHQLPPPPPPPYQSTSTNSENSLIIGENLTGVVKKINIPNPVHLNLSKEVDDDRKLKQEKTQNNTDVINPTSTKSVDNATNKAYINSSADKTTPISTKSEMMKMLKEAATFVKSPMKPESKKSYAHDAHKEQINNEQTSISRPLSRKKTLNFEPVTTRNTKQIPKTGYSPPILPIPTFQKVLLQVQTGVSNMGVKFDTQSGQSKTLTNTFNETTTGCNIPKATPKNILQSKSKKTRKKILVTEEDNAKKILLEEYKKRILKLKRQA